MKKLIAVIPERCMGCHTCEIECAVAHSEARDLRKIVENKEKCHPRVRVRAAGELNVPLQCRHCEDAPCVRVCPTGALEKIENTGTVLVHEDQCIGCRWCVLVCPFGVIGVADGKIALKCDLCGERTSQGLDPACVEGCPTHALRFVTEDEARALAQQAAAERVRQATQAAQAVREEGAA